MTIRMQAPTNLGTGVVPGQRMPSGKSYVIESQGGQIEAEPNDVGALAGYGFVPAGQLYLMPASTPLSGDELVTILQNGLVRRATTADLGGGGGVAEAPLDGNTYGRVDTSWTQVLPSADAANKLYVDSQDAKLQQSIDKLSQNLVFVGQMKVVTDTANFTAASGIPPGHLPTAAVGYTGFYVIVSDGGSPPVGSHIPPGTYARGDWIVCDSSPAWNWLQLGRTDVTAPQVAVVPAVGGQTNVQTALQYLDANDVQLTGVVPLMNGIAAVGQDPNAARGDHIHPVDTSRYSASNPNGYQTAAQVTTALGPYALTSAVPLPATTPPAINGVAAPGSGTTWSRPTTSTRWIRLAMLPLTHRGLLTLLVRSGSLCKV
jgi:hypothetical protein